MKRIFAFALVCCIILGAIPIASLAYNDAKADEEATVTRAQECGYCGKFTLTVSRNYTAWSSTGKYKQCGQNVIYNDTQRTRSYNDAYKCSSCGWGTTFGPYTETKYHHVHSPYSEPYPEA